MLVSYLVVFHMDMNRRNGMARAASCHMILRKSVLFQNKDWPIDLAGF